jgi:hypothetical protein
MLSRFGSAATLGQSALGLIEIFAHDFDNEPNVRRETGKE